VDFNSDYEDKIVALPFVKRSSKETTYIPLNILSNLYVSNGLATGNTALEAQVQALSEIYERHVKLEIIKKGYSLPAFPKEVLESFPRVQKDVEELRSHGYIVEVLDASLGGVFPVTAISFINPKSSTLFVSFGAHPILEVSLERTMTELMQGRSLENLDGFEVPTFDMSLVADSFNLEAHFIDSNGKLGFSFLSKTKSFEYAAFSYEGNSTKEEIEQLEETLNIEKYIGVIFENNFTLREFKAQCLIVLDEMDEALEILEYGSDAFAHLVVEIAKMEELELDFKEYEDALCSVYGQMRVHRALQVLDGDALLCDTTLHQDYLNMLEMYDRLEEKKRA